MKKYLIFLCLLLGALNSIAQGPNTTTISVPTGGGHFVNALLTLPDDYSSTTKKYAFLVFLHGLGEGGTNLSLIYNSSTAGGPAYFIAHSLWPSSFTNPADGQPYKFIVLSPQAPAGSGIGGNQVDPIVDYMIANYRVDMTRFSLTGLSEGGQGVFIYSVGCCGVTPEHIPQTAMPMSMAGGKPDQNACNITISKGMHVWGFGSPTDGLGINVQLWIQGNFGGNSCNCSGIGSLGRFTSYVGGHCCWGQFYDPTYRETIGGVSMNMYEWSLQFPAGAPVNIPPTANAGTNKSITLPTTTTTLVGTGTDGDGTITGYAWTQVGGTTATIVSPSSATTIINGLTTAGTYTFRLTVTDNLGSTGTSDVIVTVNPLPSPTIISSAPWAPPTTVNITKVACAEYQTVYLHADKTVHFWGFPGHYQYMDFGLTNIIDVQGAQYDCLTLGADGTTNRVRKANDGSPSVIPIPIDTFGNVFNYVQKIYGFWQSYLFIAHDSLYYLGLGNNLSYGSLGLNGGAILTKPMPLGQPAGRKIVKVVTFEQAAAGMPCIMVQCDNGTVWQYSYGSTVPTQITGFTGPAVDICGITRAAYCIITATDILAWGPFCSYFAGLTDGLTTPTSILSSFTAVGLQMPLKQSMASYNTIHFIDAKNDMYGEGDASQGELGNGIQINPWATYKNGTATAPFAWDFARGQRMFGPTQIFGKWYRICGGDNIAFFFFAQDIGAAMGLNFNWYSWGRDKNDALGNGIRAGNDDAYACWGIIPAPTYVSPASVAHVADFTFTPSNTFTPLGNAGIDQYITTTTSTLNGVASSQPEGSITAYQWAAIDGATVTSPTLSTTAVSGLHVGINRFKLTVTSNLALTDADTISVVVLSGTAPVVSAGNNQSIQPGSTTLQGSAIASGIATITNTLWFQLTGPGTATISNPSSLTTNVSGLIIGTYTFRLTATDSNGLQNSATVTIVVGSCGCLIYFTPTIIK